MSEPDPFVTTYAPYTGGRLPEVWEFAWAGEDPRERVLSYAVPGSFTPEAERPGEEHTVYPHLPDDAVLRMTEDAVTRYTGTSVIRRCEDRGVVGLYSRERAALFELPSTPAELLTAGCTFDQFTRSWQEEGVRQEGAREVVCAMVRYGVLAAPDSWSPDATAGTGSPRPEMLVEYLPQAHDEALLVSLITGQRVRLAPGAAEVWRRCAEGGGPASNNEGLASGNAADVVAGLSARGFLVRDEKGAGR